MPEDSYTELGYFELLEGSTDFYSCGSFKICTDSAGYVSCDIYLWYHHFFLLRLYLESFIRCFQHVRYLFFFFFLFFHLACYGCEPGFFFGNCFCCPVDLEVFSSTFSQGSWPHDSAFNVHVFDHKRPVLMNPEFVELDDGVCVAVVVPR